MPLQQDESPYSHPNPNGADTTDISSELIKLQMLERKKFDVWNTLALSSHILILVYINVINP